MVYVEIDIKKELPPNDRSQYFIVKHNGEGSWYEDEVSEFTGEAINGDWADTIKCWFKPVKLDSGEPNVI